MAGYSFRDIRPGTRDVAHTNRGAFTFPYLFEQMKARRQQDEQFNATMQENKRQFDENMEFSKKKYAQLLENQLAEAKTAYNAGGQRDETLRDRILQLEGELGGQAQWQVNAPVEMQTPMAPPEPEAKPADAQAKPAPVQTKPVVDPVRVKDNDGRHRARMDHLRINYPRYYKSITEDKTLTDSERAMLPWLQEEAQRMAVDDALKQISQGLPDAVNFEQSRAMKSPIDADYAPNIWEGYTPEQAAEIAAVPAAGEVPQKYAAQAPATDELQAAAAERAQIRARGGYAPEAPSISPMALARPGTVRPPVQSEYLGTRFTRPGGRVSTDLAGGDAIARENATYYGGLRERINQQYVGIPREAANLALSVMENDPAPYWHTKENFEKLHGEFIAMLYQNQRAELMARAQASGKANDRELKYLSAGKEWGGMFVDSQEAKEMEKAAREVDNLNTLTEMQQSHTTTSAIRYRIKQLLDPGSRVTDKDFQFAIGGGNLLTRLEEFINDKFRDGALSKEHLANVKEMISDMGSLKKAALSGVYQRAAESYAEGRFPNERMFYNGFYGKVFSRYGSLPGWDPKDWQPRGKRVGGGAGIGDSAGFEVHKTKPPRTGFSDEDFE